MRSGRAAVTLIAFTLVLGSTDPSAPAAGAGQSPVASSLEEQVETSLVQIEVRVDGEPEAVGALMADDFSLTVGGKGIAGLTVDRLCDDRTEDGGDDTTPMSVASASSSPSFLFFFDQPHLTQSGRSSSLELSRELIDRLVVRGARAAIVSSAAKLNTVVPLTADRSLLLQGLESLRDDSTQWDAYAAFESNRLWRINDAKQHGQARQLARSFAEEEAWQVRRATQRLGIVLGVLGDQPPPRAAFYFGNTLRKDAGAHYFDLASESPDRRIDSASASDFDRLIRDALGFGVHVFPIQAGGMSASARSDVSAEATLQSLAMETGGEAFTKGLSAAKIANRVNQRLGCLYVLSFKPNSLARDTTLPVTVRVGRKGVTPHVQGLIVIPSASTRKTTRLLAGFTQGTGDDATSRLELSLIFLSASKNEYRALAQVRTPSIATGNSTWDLGASLVSGGAVREDFAARVAADVPGVPFVGEKEITMGAGPYEIVAVGQLNGDQVFAGRIEGNLPAPGDGASVSPIAAMQEGTAAFSRAGKTRTTGTLVLGRDEPVNNHKPLAFISVVCRAGKSDPGLVVRTLSGSDDVRFAPIHFAPDDRCIQVRDVIPAKVLGPGQYRYSVVLKRNDEALQAGGLEFGVGPREESR